MRLKRLKLISFALILALLAIMLPACSPVFAAESFMALIPEVLHSGQTEEISLALFNGESLASGNVEVTLLDDGKEILKAEKRINGKGTLELKIPDVEDGEYEILVKGAGFEDKASVSIEKSFLTFLETDKPIYKPGQTIHIRLITLDNELMPLEEQVVIEVLDAKGIKIFRSETTTDEYGMASLELPLSTEPNLGAWKITAATEYSKTQLDVRVEEYVLPKYEVNVELPKQWFLVNEAISGSISAEYSFGKPVSGEIEITASRYVGEWEEYAIFTKSIDGDTDFEIPAVGYVTGTPASGGLGNVILDVIVRETSTGYEEKISVLLTVAETALNIQIIPESVVFKPGLPFNLLFITETPANEPLDAKLNVNITYLDAKYNEIIIDEKEVITDNGTALTEINPPDNAVAMIIEAFELTPISSVPPAEAEKIVAASYSPSGNFIHLEQITQGIPEVGEQVIFKVNSTREAANFYYEVIARGSVVFSDFTSSNTISFDVTPLMAPSARLLVYQILPNSEVAADYLPFKVTAEYPHDVTVEFSDNEAAPGDEIEINIETDGEARVGITVVDKSVYILAENRLNLQQVFDELERLYMQPQVELHEATIYPSIITQGAKDVFEDSGMIILSNNELPQGEEYKAEDNENFWDGLWRFFNGGAVLEDAQNGALPPSVVVDVPDATKDASDLAEIDRVRQFFPETWLWEEIIVGEDGKISVPVTVPDTITTWMLHAVAISKDSGLGMAEDELIAFQPFFIKVDLPYSAIRGEEFPVKIAVYNYLDEPQEVLVQIEEAGWFELLDDSAKTVTVAANDIGGVEFMIKPNGLGFNELKLTAQSTQAADAVIKSLLVQPEGVPREFVENLVLADGMIQTVDTGISEFAIADSGRAYIALTSSFLTQTIEGLEGLIQMPFGCGEQNMIVFAPDVYITKYLKESGQLKPEIMAKAEKLMITGYQRELTYRRSDGSFSAFGQSDAEGSLWLTAFVLKSFAEAEDLIYIDSAVLQEAADWLISHQNSDGSFEPVGFVHHQEMLGGLQGKNALTAYTAIALMEAGENSSASKAINYLEGVLEGLENPYTLAITAYALELGGSDSSDAAYNMLMELAIEDENGLHWSSGDMSEEEVFNEELIAPGSPIGQNQSADIETTAYAALALIEHGDAFNASRAAKWLVSQRNAYGGFGSTQDTVMALQALIRYSSGSRADVDLTVTITTSEGSIVKTITEENYDVLQIIEVPVNDQVVITVEGEGEAIAQVVKRFNLPQAEEGDSIFDINVDYDTTEVEVNDLVTVSVELGFNPPQPMEAGMIVLDISIPTGFMPVTETIAEITASNENIKRYEIAGRKVIFYIENMQAGDSLLFSFQVKAEFPVKAKGVASQVYSYYQPELRGETLGEDVTVN